MKHLVKHNIGVLDRNFRKKWGEIDIVAQDNVSRPHTLHFIEVKGIKSEENKDDYMPEENVHHAKRQRLWRAIQSWLLEHNIPEETEWQVDVMAVFLDLETKRARIRWTKNIILGE